MGLWVPFAVVFLPNSEHWDAPRSSAWWCGDCNKSLRSVEAGDIIVYHSARLLISASFFSPILLHFRFLPVAYLLSFSTASLPLVCCRALTLFSRSFSLPFYLPVISLSVFALVCTLIVLLAACIILS